MAPATMPIPMMTAIPYSTPPKRLQGLIRSSQTPTPMVNDSLDAFPLDNTETLDTDNDGTGNNADPDDDDDGVNDNLDAFPLDNTETLDTDNDNSNNADLR